MHRIPMLQINFHSFEPRFVSVHRDIHSHLAYTALLGWADGNLSCVGMVRLCRSGARDGLRIPMLDTLANLANDEMTNVVRKLKTDVLKRAGVYARITPLTGPHFKHCVLPSTTFKFLASYPQQFKLRMAANAEACTNFWRGLFSSEEGMDLKQLHPHLRGKTLAQLSHHIPLRIHEDAGPFTKIKSVNVLSCSSLLGKGTELESKYPRHLLGLSVV